MFLNFRLVIGLHADDLGAQRPIIAGNQRKGRGPGGNSVFRLRLTDSLCQRDDFRNSDMDSGGILVALALHLHMPGKQLHRVVDHHVVLSQLQRDHEDQHHV